MCDDTIEDVEVNLFILAWNIHKGIRNIPTYEERQKFLASYAMQLGISIPNIQFFTVIPLHFYQSKCSGLPNLNELMDNFYESW